MATQIIIWKIGDKDRPASQEDIDSFKIELERALKAPVGSDQNSTINIVTHHAVETSEIYHYADTHHVFG